MGRNREVAGICLDLLYAELVAAVPSRPVLFAIGVQVGLQLTERHTTECRRFADHLEMIKFICKEFWQEVFQKQIDNLKTNRYREVFVLQDSTFKWIQHPCLNEHTPESEDSIATRLMFPCGLVKGALAGFGLHCDVSAELVDRSLGTCAFHIRTRNH
mmetsp:Transcript_26229/g.49823  ORF Transcript_26229/g.49823 Transcript_26229/m.49823 type:complete len:158 (+) Transcript_26229:141-614(+)